MTFFTAVPGRSSYRDVSIDTRNGSICFPSSTGRAPSAPLNGAKAPLSSVAFSSRPNRTFHPRSDPSHWNRALIFSSSLRSRSPPISGIPRSSSPDTRARSGLAMTTGGRAGCCASRSSACRIPNRHAGPVVGRPVVAGEEDEPQAAMNGEDAVAIVEARD